MVANLILIANPEGDFDGGDKRRSENPSEKSQRQQGLPTSDSPSTVIELR
jgi:hypothetical protein